MKNIVCPICNIDDTSLLFVKDTYNVVACKKCKLVYVNPQPDDSVLNDLYEKSYGEFYIRNPTKMKSKFRDAGRDINRLGKLKRLPHGKLLDVGCSYGYLVKTAHDLGWEAMGVDLSENAIDFSRNSYAINVQVGDIYTVDTFDHFDFITMFDVIEHVRNPVDYLKKAYSLLNNGGYLIIGTPDVSHYKARNTSWSDYQPPKHLFYFDRNTLRRACEMAGFTFVKKYIRSPFRATLKAVFQKSPHQ
jgi:2-polyprenyl-3-methyl-5-hydroxy-6-metoxy-1,4-benzoquinol methylase/Zn ribbon nucleic-acid-binding protein